MEVRGVSFLDIFNFDNHVVDRQRNIFDEFLSVTCALSEIPDHWAIFKDAENPIFIVGISEVSPKEYDSFTLFSKHVCPKHLPFIIKFVKNYIRMLDYSRIIHAVETEDTAMRKFIQMMGFSESHEVGEKTIYHKVKVWV